MLKKTTLLIIILFNFSYNVNALNRIDKYILNNGVSACNGESPNCRDFYTKAIELNDEQTPISPEIKF